MKLLSLTSLLLLLTSCTSATKPTSIVVDVGKQQLQVKKGSVPVLTVPVETSRRGIGNKLNSKRTPVGEFTVVKYPNHRFGEVLRLNGYQGYTRGILIHKKLNPGNGTSGCISPTYEDMKKIFKLVENNTPLTIRA